MRDPARPEVCKVRAGGTLRWVPTARFIFFALAPTTGLSDDSSDPPLDRGEAANRPSGSGDGRPRAKGRDRYGNAALIRLAAPLIASVACFALTLFTDRTLLMWHDPTQSGASMAAGNLYWTIVCVPVTAMGFVTPLIAAATIRRPGDHAHRRKQRMATLVWQSGWITVAAVPVLGIVAWVAPAIFRASGHEAALVASEATYLRLLLMVAPASMLEAGWGAFFIGRRMTAPVVRLNIVAAVINVVMDGWLIFGAMGVPALGIRGAAIATAVAMWTKVLIYAVLIVRSEAFRRGTPGQWRPQGRVAIEILAPGGTLGVGQLVRSGLMSYVLIGIGAVSTVGLAASTAAMSIYQFVAIPMVGLATAVTVMSSEAVSESGGYRLAWSVIGRASRMSAVYMGGCLLVMWGFPGIVLRISLGSAASVDDPELWSTAISLLRIAAVYGLLDVTLLIFGAGLKGLGMTLSLLLSTCFAAGLAWLFSRWPVGENGSSIYFWWAVLMVWAVGQTVAYAVVLGFKYGGLRVKHGIGRCRDGVWSAAATR